MTDLNEISSLAEKLFAAQLAVVELEADLKEAQRLVLQLGEHDLPEAMDDVGLKTLDTAGGLVVKVSNKLHAKKLTQAHGKALDWLREHGNAGLIKTQVAVPFTAGSESDAEALLNRLAGEGFVASKASSVHHSSLSSVLTKMLEEGEEIPDFMGAHQVTKALVTPSKK